MMATFQPFRLQYLEKSEVTCKIRGTRYRLEDNIQMDHNKIGWGSCGLDSSVKG
jgi:hypothetical protein